MSKVVEVSTMETRSDILLLMLIYCVIGYNGSHSDPPSGNLVVRLSKRKNYMMDLISLGIPQGLPKKCHAAQWP
jgi:hypothetical protein